MVNEITDTASVTKIVRLGAMTNKHPRKQVQTPVQDIASNNRVKSPFKVLFNLAGP
jgi:hypothetical protein